ncbi:MAG: 30S ribosomal protein S9 [Candidatus Brocadiia bacterium]|jgi:small subunit ribosomal protein S9
MVEEATVLATGRRKSSVARVWLHRGTGVVKINSREIEQFFPIERHRASVLAPLKITKTLGKFDVVADVFGGGLSGQAEAIMLGVARALRRISSDTDAALRESGLLTRDSRMKERKKYGRRAARRSFQFSKR